MKINIKKNYPGSVAIFPIVIFLIGMMFFMPMNNALALTLDEIITGTQSAYEKTADLKADFTQESVVKSMGRIEKEEGVFYFKNPRRMVWDYKKPKIKKLVINSKTAWFYIPEDKAVYVQNAESVFKSRLGMRFLSGMGQLKKDFRITFAKPINKGQKDDYLLKLVPKEADYGIGELTIAVDKENFYVNRLSFMDAYGNTTRLYFKNIKTNNKLPDKMFNFSPPRGVEIFK